MISAIVLDLEERRQAASAELASCRAQRAELKRELAEARALRDQRAVERIADDLGRLDDREWAAMSAEQRRAVIEWWER